MNTKQFCGAIDIGGTKIAVGIVDSEGTVYQKDVIPTPQSQDPDVTVRDLSRLIRLQCERADIPFLRGIGIGCAGPVDYRNGIVKNPYTLSLFSDFPLAQRLSDACGVPAILDNDVNVAMLGEVIRGNIYEQSALMVFFGTGVGVSVWLGNNGLYRASGQPYHPEMGHVLADPLVDTPICYCGRKGCLESLLSGTALNSQSVRLGYADFDHLASSAQRGDAVAGAFMEKCGVWLGQAFWNLMLVFRPNIVILGGGLMTLYYPLAKKALQTFVKPVFGMIDEYEVRRAETDNDSTLAGAASLIFGRYQ